jgi:thioredoxin-like negative regulator of GroEL
MRRGSTLVALLVSVTALGAEGAIPWRTEVKQAIDESKRTGRPLLVDFWAVWCKPCKQMDETTYRDPAVVSAAAAFVPLKVDQDVQVVFSDRHRVEMLPMILLLDGEGREISRLAGLVEAPRLVPLLEHVSDGYAAYLTARDARGDAPETQVALAGFLLGAGNAEEAERLLKKAVKALAAAPAAEREPVELQLARAEMAAGDGKSAAKSLERLASEATLPEVRGGALEALVELWRERGDAEQAQAALERLRGESPERAQALED